jgi:fructose 1,6-bisphosphatase
MKKYYKLGLISLVPLPLLSITSCSAETKIEELNITVKQEIAQEIIDKSILDYNAEKATDDDKVIALNQVFIGVNKTNLHQMTITTIKTNGEVLGKIDLKANSGFTFNGVEGDSISASSLPVVNPELKKINITIRKKTSQNVIDKAITTYNEAINDTDKITALNTIFI